MSHIAQFDIPAYKNDTMRFFIDFFEDEAKTTPFDLTQFAEWNMEVKLTPRAGAVLLLTLGAGLTISNTNRMTFDATKAQMNFLANTYAYDLEGNNPAGDRETILRGSLIQEQDITTL